MAGFHNFTAMYWDGIIPLIMAVIVLSPALL